MKVLAIFTLLIFVVSCAKVDVLEGLTEEQAFEKAIKIYNKVYVSENEYNHRFGVFKKNLAIIEELNAKDPEAIFGITQFFDLTPKEFADIYLLKNYSSHMAELEEKGLLEYLPAAPEHPNISAPAAYDWNSKGCVTPVYNQGTCGSCWAFAVTENLESMACIAKKGLRNFSMQQVLDCDSTGTCKGGYVNYALAYAVKNGIMLYNSYPYSGSKGSCRYNPNSVAQRFSNWGYVDVNRNENNILNWIYSYGAPAACVDAKTWQYYQGGMITANCGTAIDHCIQITGWTTMSGKLAWKVRNSWGPNWGSSGYLYIAVGYNLCAIAQSVVTAY